MASFFLAISTACAPFRFDDPRHGPGSLLHRPHPVGQGQPVVEPDRRPGLEAGGRQRRVRIAAKSFAAKDRHAAWQAHVDRAAQMETVVAELEKQDEDLRPANDGDRP